MRRQQDLNPVLDYVLGYLGLLIVDLADDHYLPLPLLQERLCRHVEDHVFDDPPLVADLSHSGTVAGP